MKPENPNLIVRSAYRMRRSTHYVKVRFQVGSAKI
jgi:hypothetical protein